MKFFIIIVPGRQTVNWFCKKLHVSCGLDIFTYRLARKCVIQKNTHSTCFPGIYYTEPVTLRLIFISPSLGEIPTLHESYDRSSTGRRNEGACLSRRIRLQINVAKISSLFYVFSTHKIVSLFKVLKEMSQIYCRLIEYFINNIFITSVSIKLEYFTLKFRLQFYL